jgi:hypothetical protein
MEEEVVYTLREKNVKHFSQAKNTPCAKGELAKLLNENGLSKVMKNALKNIIPTNIEQRSNEILLELKQTRPQINDYLPINAMVSGFTKWREKTTTSPCEKHQGIYRTITKAYCGAYDVDLEKKISERQNSTIREFAKNALRIQNNIMNLAIQQCHTLSRWQTVHNVFLEKNSRHTKTG